MNNAISVTRTLWSPLAKGSELWRELYPVLLSLHISIFVNIQFYNITYCNITNIQPKKINKPFGKGTANLTFRVCLNKLFTFSMKNLNLTYTKPMSSGTKLGGKNMAQNSMCSPFSLTAVFEIRLDGRKLPCAGNKGTCCSAVYVRKGLELITIRITPVGLTPL
ncbi:MAG: hypothetical protein CM15mP49_33040 [Actinomycetota bacterium]|nr:MAG: hypothetical protein CM15mP49_33040 [Actinomycetota bacterium]